MKKEKEERVFEVLENIWDGDSEEISIKTKSDFRNLLATNTYKNIKIKELDYTGKSLLFEIKEEQNEKIGFINIVEIYEGDYLRYKDYDYYNNHKIENKPSAEEVLPDDPFNVNKINSSQVIPETEQEKLIIQKCDELKELLIRKNRDYGNSAQKSFEKWGHNSFLFRIEDKMNRIENLIKTGNENREINDESLEDSVKDSAGYFLLWLVEMSKKESRK